MADLVFTGTITSNGSVTTVTITTGNTISGQIVGGPPGPAGAEGPEGPPGQDGSDGVMASIVAGANIDVDATDPANPIVSVENLVAADITDVTATATELNYTDGVTSAIQAQLDAKVPTSRTINGDALSSNVTLNQDDIGDGTTYKQYSATEKTKLAGIETAADVTDTANVTSAGALMDSEVTNLAAVKSFDPTDYATDTQGATADSALQPGDIASGTITARADDINFSAGSDGDVLTVQADGSLALEAPSGGGGGGTVDSVVAGTNIDVDATDPANPVVSVETLTIADISGITASAAELNIMDGVTADAAEINKLDGLLPTTTELNYVDGVTSAIQTQIDGKQPLDSDLTTIAGLTATTDNFLVSVSSAWASRTPSQVRTTLALVIGTNVQAWDADLDAIAALGVTNDSFIQGKGGVWSKRTVAQVLTDLAAAGTTFQPLDADLTTIAGLTPTTDNFMVGTASAWASRTPTQARSQMGLGSLATLSTINGSNWSGTDLAIADGGTGQSTAAAAFDALKQAASTTYVGAVELAIDTEVNTGTSATLAVTPDALSASYAGTKCVCIAVSDPLGAGIAVGNGQAFFTVPSAMGGMDLVRAQATVTTAGATGASTIMVRNVTQGADMLTGAISIASAGTVGTVGTIDATNDDVATNDVIAIDIDSVSTTPPKGLMVILEFRLP